MRRRQDHVERLKGEAGNKLMAIRLMYSAVTERRSSNRRVKTRLIP